MKKNSLILIVFVLLASISCQEKLDYEKEMEAIKAIIEGEAKAHLARDFDQQSKFFLQDSSFIGLASDNERYYYFVGWEDMSSMYKEFYKQKPIPSTFTFKNSNYKIKIFNESAWVVFDEKIFNSEGEFFFKRVSVRFLEKVDGEWKIAYFSYVNTTSYEEYFEEGEAE